MGGDAAAVGDSAAEVAAIQELEERGCVFPNCLWWCKGMQKRRKAEANRLYSEAFDLWDEDRFLRRWMNSNRHSDLSGSRKSGEEGKTLHYLVTFPTTWESIRKHWITTNPLCRSHEKSGIAMRKARS